MLYVQEFVFCMAKQNFNNVQVAPGQYQDIKLGDVNILQYRAIVKEVLNGTMELL